MKLSKNLLSSGVLGRGETRHCSDWEFADVVRQSRLSQSAVVRQAEVRRSRRMRAAAGKGFWAKTVGIFGGNRND